MILHPFTRPNVMLKSCPCILVVALVLGLGTTPSSSSSSSTDHYVRIRLKDNVSPVHRWHISSSPHVLVGVSSAQLLLLPVNQTGVDDFVVKSFSSDVAGASSYLASSWLMICSTNSINGTCDIYSYPELEFMTKTISVQSVRSEPYSIAASEIGEKKDKIIFFSSYSKRFPTLNAISLLDSQTFAFSGYREGYQYPDQIQLLKNELKQETQNYVRHIFEVEGRVTAFSVENWRSSRSYGTRVTLLCDNNDWTQQLQQLWLRCAGLEVLTDVKLVSAYGNLAKALSVRPGAKVYIVSFEKHKNREDTGGEGSICAFSYDGLQKKIATEIDICVQQKGISCPSFFSSRGVCSKVPTDRHCFSGSFICTDTIVDGHILYSSSTTILLSLVVYTRAHYDSADPENTFILTGTNTNMIYKFWINDTGLAHRYASLSVQGTGGDPFIASFTLEGDDRVAMATSRNVYLVDKYVCLSYTDCDACETDANCGWCILSNRCSLYEKCNHKGEPDRYLTTSCPVAKVLDGGYVDIANDATILLRVLLLPRLLSGEKYVCIIDGEETAADLKNSTTLQCSLPSTMSLRGEQKRSVDVTIRHSAYSDGFLSTSVVYFDCRIFSACNQCSANAFVCKWCPLDNKCVGVTADTTCSVDQSSTDQQKCPSIADNKEILIAANHTSNIQFSTVNLLPSDTYQCIFMLPKNNKYTVAATRISPTSIRCLNLKVDYTQKEASIQVKVQLMWLLKYTIDSQLTVTIYKCSEMAKDCSTCLSLLNGITSKYRCTWCQHRACEYDEACPNSANICPRPVIQSIYPTSGAIDGGQLLEIKGNNLGIKFSDIKDAVSIGGKRCEAIEKDYDISKRLKCRVPAAKIGNADVIIKLPKQSPVTSSIKYTYTDPKLNSMKPAIGPLSGGTLVQITGLHLLTGKGVKVFFGDKSLRYTCTSITKNGTNIECLTPLISEPSNGTLRADFDGVIRRYQEEKFNFVSDPNVTDIVPLTTIASGGKVITIKGYNFNCIENPKIFFIYKNKFSKEQECRKISDTILNCLSPKLTSLLAANTSVPGVIPPVRKRRSTESQIGIGFKMDGVYKLRDLQKYYPDLNLVFTSYPDPIFSPFPENPYLFNGDTLVINGEYLNSGVSKDDIKVNLGTNVCDIKSLTDTALYCSVSIADDLIDTDVEVSVEVGDWLTYDIGVLRYSGSNRLNRILIIGIVLGVVALIAVFSIILVFYARKSSAASRQFKKIQIQLDTLESNVRNECRQAFAELQTEVSDFQDDVNHKGIPFRDFKTYTFKILFPTHADHPIFHKNLTSYADCELNLLRFAQLLNSKRFLIIFIKTLEKQKAFQIRDKSLIASLLTVIFHDKMDYATDILTNLLGDLIDHSIETKNPKLLLRRHESVVEKFLTNWMSLCMYDYLKNDAGKTLYLLYKSIKYQSEKGPVDAITGAAKYSLSDNTLLRENIEYKQLNIRVYCKSHLKPVPCKVLDCDTISQTKYKILDAVYRNQAYSQRPTIHQVEIQWKTGKLGGYIVLEDDDISTITSSTKARRLNTLQHYRVPSEADFSLVENLHCKDDVHKINGRIEIMSGLMLNAVVEDGIDCWHLVKRDTNPNSRGTKVISEIFLTRLLSTKGILEKFIDNLFKTILESGARIPPAIKYLFDFFDESARKHNITDPDVVHAWKSNSLPLRFWVNILKNPDFIFDVNKTSIIDSCLSVVASSFMDSCSLTEHRLGKDSPSNKLLFAKDIPKYKTLIKKYFQLIQEMPKISTEEIMSLMRQHSEQHRMDLNVNAALKELLTFARQYSFEILVNLEEDCSAKKLRLATKFDEVLGNPGGGVSSNF